MSKDYLWRYLFRLTLTCRLPSMYILYVGLFPTVSICFLLFMWLLLNCSWRRADKTYTSCLRPYRDPLNTFDDHSWTTRTSLFNTGHIWWKIRVGSSSRQLHRPIPHYRYTQARGPGRHQLVEVRAETCRPTETWDGTRSRRGRREPAVPGVNGWHPQRIPTAASRRSPGGPTEHRRCSAPTVDNRR